VEHHLADEGQESAVLSRDAFLRDEIEEAAKRPIDADGGLIVLDGTDEFFGDGLGVKELSFLLGVSEAKGFVSFGAIHAALAAVDGGEAAAVFVGDEDLGGGR